MAGAQALKHDSCMADTLCIRLPRSFSDKPSIDFRAMANEVLGQVI